MRRERNVSRTETSDNLVRLTGVANRLDAAVSDLESVLRETKRHIGEAHADDGSTDSGRKSDEGS